MLVFDTSSIVYAWDNYPSEQFPGLWAWLGKELESSKICFPEVVQGEVEHVSPDCFDWLSGRDVAYVPMSNSILREALRLKDLLEIGARFGGGVGENDLFIIATAKVNNVGLVSNEAVQNLLPKSKANYKIPAVCGLSTVDVSCISFLDYFKRTKAVV